MQNAESGASDHHMNLLGWKVDIYIGIWVILLLLTLGEVFYAFLPLPKMMLALGLVAMAVWKAAYRAAAWKPTCCSARPR